MIFDKYSVPRWLVFIQYSVIVFVTFLFAYLLRFNFVLSAIDINHAVYHALLTLVVYTSFRLIFKSFSGLIRHTTIQDIFKVVSCNTYSLAVLISISLIGRNLNWNGIFIFPLSILVIHYGILSVSLFLIRVLIKMTFEFITVSSGEKKNVLIFGAVTMAILVKKIIQTDSTSGYKTIGLIDEDKKLKGKEFYKSPDYCCQ